MLFPYRCIETAQKMPLSDQVTALVGRNEAGKTTVLELLAKSNYYNTEDKEFWFQPSVDYPVLSGRDIKETVWQSAAALTYRVPGELLEKIRKDMILLEQHSEFTRITGYDGSYRLAKTGLPMTPVHFGVLMRKRERPGFPLIRWRCPSFIQSKILSGSHTECRERQGLQSGKPYGRSQNILKTGMDGKTH